jgi:RNA polymerase sigma factor (sigma-70 family)
MTIVNRSTATDAELLRLTPQNAEAFGFFYERYEREMLAFFWRRTRRADLAADLASEVFASALESVTRFDPDRGPARAWLFGIARHQLADAWERGRVEDRARQRLGIGPVALSDETIERIERLDAAQSGVLDLLDELPEDQRAAVSGRIIDERDYAELASGLACSQSVVRQRVRRGLGALRRRLQNAQAQHQSGNVQATRRSKETNDNHLPRAS